MDSAKVFVRAVRGRYPSRPGKLQARHIEASVVEEEENLLIRLDDREHPDFWLLITLEIAGEHRAGGRT